MPETLDVPRELSALTDVVSFLDGHIEAHKLDASTAFCLHLAAEELFTNMVRHNVGGGEIITIDIDISPERILLGLIDHDVEPFDPASVPEVDVTAPAEDRRPGGLGMHLVRSIVDRVSYEYKDREMRVSIRKNRDQ